MLTSKSNNPDHDVEFPNRGSAMEDTVAKVHWSVAQKYPDGIALMSKGRDGAWESMSFRQFAAHYECFGAGMLDFGVRRGDHIGIISDNSREWMIANLGILGIGAADVPRGSDTMPDEARYILHHADCAVTLAENAEQLKKILGKKKDIPLLTTIIVIDEGFQPESFTQPTLGVQVITYRDIMSGEGSASRPIPRPGNARCRRAPPTSLPRSSTHRGPPASQKA